MAASVIPWILIPVLPLLLVFLFLRRYFLRTSRDVKRLEATSELFWAGVFHPHAEIFKIHTQQNKMNHLKKSVCFPVARSPVFSHLSSSLQGLSTIRAFKAEERFQQTFDSHQDLHSGTTMTALTKCFMYVAEGSSLTCKKTAVASGFC